MTYNSDADSKARAEPRLFLSGFLQVRAASIRLMIDENVEVLDVSGQGLKIASRVPFISQDLVVLAIEHQKIDAQVVWSYQEGNRYFSGLVVLEPYHLENWLQDRGYLFEEIS